MENEPHGQCASIKMHAAVLVQAPTGKISYVIGGLQTVKNKPKVTTVQAAWRDLFHKGHLSGYLSTTSRASLISLNNDQAKSIPTQACLKRIIPPSFVTEKLRMQIICYSNDPNWSKNPVTIYQTKHKSTFSRCLWTLKGLNTIQHRDLVAMITPFIWKIRNDNVQELTNQPPSPSMEKWTASDCHRQA